VDTEEIPIMMMTKMALPRRTFLRGIGATVALPLLDAMIPALSAGSRSAAMPARRLGFVYVPNGVAPGYWKPTGEGTRFELSPSLSPLAPFRDQLIVPTGLCQVHANGLDNGDHTRGQAVWLSGVAIKLTQGADVRNGTTVDQLAAQTLGKDTALRSLELTVGPNFVAGTCDSGYSCAYNNTISWRTPTTPMPTEANPRAVFERLFGDGATAAARRARLSTDSSILDSVTTELARLQRTLGSGDLMRVNEFTDAIREIERRIQAQERTQSELVDVPERPLGIPEAYEEHVKLLFDLVVLAFQADITRVFTFIMGREQGNQPYSQIGVPEGQHAVSHHQNDPIRLEKYHKINKYHLELLAHFLERLKGTSDGEGNLLDHAMILHGSGINDGDRHDHVDLPLVLVGGGAGQLKGGRVLGCPPDTPMNNLHMALLDKVGAPAEKFGDATGTLALEPLSGV
jgi:hypothetical protein